MHKELFQQALQSLGVQVGDLLLIHSDLRPFGLPTNCQTAQEIVHFYYEALREMVGPLGTLAVPAYFYEYARYGEPFDCERSPVSKSLGVLSRYINSLPGRVRSANPLQSLAAIGAQGEALCGGNSLMGYGLNSPWHRLRLLQGKMLFIGTNLQPMTFVHHIEQQFGVPHLYQKFYATPILRAGTLLPGNAVSSVRYLNFQIHYHLLFFQQELQRQGKLQVAEINGAPLFLVSAEEAFQVGVEMLSQNLFCFLQKPPTFIPGTIPADGITGVKDEE